MLPYFIVSRDGGSGIVELKDMSNLQGDLCIRGLESVDIEKDAVSANLLHKKYLNKLVLEWDFLRYIEDSIKEKSLLEQLCPHTNLNSLTIKYYGGTSFPNWLGDCSFSNMVSIVLRNCKYCFSLPPFGQLHALKELKIEGFDRLLGVGHEFYGNDSSTIKPFRSLK